MERNLISEAVELVGLTKLAKLLGVSYQAIRKWEACGCLPRTEWTGETSYASTISAATDGKISEAALLSLKRTKPDKHGKNQLFSSATEEAA